MTTCSYTEARQNLKSLCDTACDCHSPITINRREGGNVVIISEQDFSALEETAYLLRSPKNAERLTKAINRNSSNVKEYLLTDLADEIAI